VKVSTDHSKKIRILLVDDHPLVRRALRQVIERESDMTVCGEAEDRDDALTLLAASSPHLVVVDISLRSSDGLELVKDICRMHSGVVSFVLSMHNESFHAVRSIQAGANGYLSKQEAPDEMIRAFRKVLGGEIYWPEGVVAETVNHLTIKGFIQNGEVARQLSQRELQVFELIGVGSTPAQIAAIMDVEVTTVDTYRTRIKEKLSLKGSTELRHEAIRWNIAKNSR